MTYKQLIILIFQSDLPDELKQRLYNLRVAEGQSFSALLQKELRKLIDSGVQYKLSKNETPGTLWESLNNETDAKALDDSYAELPALVGSGPYIYHAYLITNLLDIVKQSLSNPDFLNSALRHREPFDASNTLRDDRDKDQLLAFLLDAAFDPKTYLINNKGRIYAYLVEAFSPEEFAELGYDMDLFYSYENTQRLREAVILEAVLSFGLESSFLTEVSQYNEILYDRGKVSFDNQAEYLKQLRNLALVISKSDSRLLHGHMQELLEILRTTVSEYQVEKSQYFSFVEELQQKSMDAAKSLSKDVYEALADYHVANTHNQVMQVFDTELSYPFNYWMNEVRGDDTAGLVDADVNAKDKGEQELVPVLHPGKREEQSLIPNQFSFAYLKGFNPEMQAYYNNQPLPVRLHIGGVVKCLSKQAADAYFQDIDQVDVGNDSVNRLCEMAVVKAKENVGLEIIHSLHPSDVQAALERAEEDKLKLSLINTITGVEKRLVTIASDTIKLLGNIHTAIDQYNQDQKNAHLYAALMDTIAGVKTLFADHENKDYIYKNLLANVLPSYASPEITMAAAQKMESFLYKYNHVNVFASSMIKRIKLAMTAFSGHEKEELVLMQLNEITADISKVATATCAKAFDADEEEMRAINDAASDTQKQLAGLLYKECIDFLLPAKGVDDAEQKNQQLKSEALIEAAVESVLVASGEIGTDDLLPDLIKRSAEHELYGRITSGELTDILLNVYENFSDKQSPGAGYTLTLYSAAEFVKSKGNTQPVDGFERITAQEFKDANLADTNKELQQFAVKQAFIPLEGDLQMMLDDHREFARKVRMNPEEIKAYLNNAVREAVADLVPFDHERGLSFTISVPGYNKAGQDFVVFEEDGERYVRVIHDVFQIMHNTANGVNNIGKIRQGVNAASIEVVYRLTDKDNVAGLELVYFETNHKQLKALLENRWNNEVNLANFLLANIHQSRLASLTPDELTYYECELMLTEQLKVLKDANPDSSLVQHAQQVLDEVKNVKNNPDARVQDRSLNKVLLDATMLIKSPTQTAAQNFKKLAENVQRRPWGKLLAGTMLALAGVAILGLSIAACVFTFGAAAPITVFGFVLGASTLGAGLSVAGAVVGAGAAIGGAALFHSGFKRKPLRKAMEDLADDDSEGLRGPGRQR